ncbi:MAG: hypothetical protein IT287_05330 [Bdellovibrionaceae bacterium]|nr:hypothetical protein [Pseudobdellovibrionaceae bacterium]
MRFQNSYPFELAKIHRNNPVLSKRRYDCNNYLKQLEDTFAKISKTHLINCSGFKPLAQEIEKTKLQFLNIAHQCLERLDKNSQMTQKYQIDVVDVVYEYLEQYPTLRSTASEP